MSDRSIIEGAIKHEDLSSKIRGLQSELQTVDRDLKKEIITDGKVDLLSLNWRALHELVSMDLSRVGLSEALRSVPVVDRKQSRSKI